MYRFQNPVYKKTNRINSGRHDTFAYPKICFEHISDVPFNATSFCLLCSSSIRFSHRKLSIFIISYISKTVNILFKFRAKYNFIIQFHQIVTFNFSSHKKHQIYTELTNFNKFSQADIPYEYISHKKGDNILRSVSLCFFDFRSAFRRSKQGLSGRRYPRNHRS